MERSGHVVDLLPRPGERAGAYALRAALETGGFPVDPSGRLVGGFRLARDGMSVPPDVPVESGTYALVFEPAALRVVEIVVRTDPPTRMRTPVSLAVPARWLVAGLTDWLGLEGEWVATVDGAVAAADAPLGDALGEAEVLVIERR